MGCAPGEDVGFLPGTRAYEKGLQPDLLSAFPLPPLEVMTHADEGRSAHRAAPGPEDAPAHRGVLRAQPPEAAVPPGVAAGGAAARAVRERGGALPLRRAAGP